jgi:LppP/LprE lipoprotein
MPIPVAPQGQKNPDPRCRELAREPASEVDQRVRAEGWDLVGPTSESEQVRVIVGTADYDGMCRPRHYQEFAFVRGVFAGTLSPVPMDSRTDGALGRVTFQSDGRVQAEYARYASADPLCCPSRITTVMFEIEKQPPVLQPVSASTVFTRSPKGK